jgi:hypothetical protein
MKFSNANHLETPNLDLLESSNIDLLKQEVENTLGRKILFSSDCHFLQNHIFKQLQFSVSFNTLRRFFRLMEANHQQSAYTLNVLSNYCGFPSFNDFVRYKKQSQSCGTEQENLAMVNYLIKIFKSIEVKSINDTTYLNLITLTLLFLEHQPHFLEPFHREIARTENGQKFYFEKFIYIDKLNTYYGDGLRYYLRENKTVEAQIFGHSILCFRCWLTGNNMGVEHHYQEVIKHPSTRLMPQTIAGCYFASQVFYVHSFNKPQDYILMDMRRYYSSLKSSKENLLVIFQFIRFVSQALLLTGQYEEASYYIDEAIKKGKNYNFIDNDFGVREAIDLFYIYAKAHLGEITTAKELLTTISINNFYFLHKRFLTIMYLSLKQKFQKNKHDREQLQSLIAETGFSKLLN